MKATFEKCVQELETVCGKAGEEGKDVVVKEHVNWLLNPAAEGKWAFSEKEVREGEWIVDSLGTTRTSGNETVFSNEFLRTWSPTFLIRHPALVFPSNYRTLFDLHGAEAAKNEAYHAIEMTMRWSRGLYDWYTAYSPDSAFPVILDADDIMLDASIVRRYAQLLGLDPEKLRFQWSPAKEEELKNLGRAARRMVSTIAASKGVVEGKTGLGVDIGDEAVKWRKEFGDEEGNRIEAWVRNAMGDYAYMRERRFM